MAENYDVVVIGGGPGGYSAAIRAAQLGMKVALVEKEAVGGTCLHRGCMPTKTYLESATRLRQAREQAEYGIITDTPTFQFEAAFTRKNRIVAELQAGIESLLKKGKISVYSGYARILGPSIFSPMPGTISVEQENGEENIMLLPQHIIVATGSKPRKMEALSFDGERIVSSDHLVQMEQLPTSILIVGGGVIGVEWASMFIDVGVEVTLVETAAHILPQADKDIAKEVEKQLRGRGVTVYTNAALQLETVDVQQHGVTATIVQGEEKHVIDVEKACLAIGREANVTDLGLQNTEIVVEHGYIRVNEHYQTKEAHIYAIGDCIATPQLAHVAMREGMLAAEHIAGQKIEPVNPLHVPACIYSYPEAAYIGMTEAQAKEAYSQNIRVAKMPLSAVGKARVHGETAGFIKVIEHAETNDIIGVHIVGTQATELIAHSSLAMTVNASGEEVGLAIMAHPTVAEGLGEAALLLDKRAIHF
ncbi:dihydrolipoyl dehydrogenase [Caryophanon tenue]|uniref:Dihydrolipoyl dehydrogenase n=1 Tax=Caryophanon tenue TaxID=33978 RepID=A0A1C0YN92_9BACL|nr:dihydrolipoyl dehydrogenase [Caryophanon tenue]OCS88631.1 dihydrolipoyl dehydrogenase [Caryophanon tenue]